MFDDVCYFKPDISISYGDVEKLVKWVISSTIAMLSRINPGVKSMSKTTQLPPSSYHVAMYHRWENCWISIPKSVRKNRSLIILILNLLYIYCSFKNINSNVVNPIDFTITNFTIPVGQAFLVDLGFGWRSSRLSQWPAWPAWGVLHQFLILDQLLDLGSHISG